MKALVLGTVMCVLGGLPAVAQEATQKLLFTLNREGPPLTQYSIEVNEAGQGVYVPRVLPQMDDAAPATVPTEGKALQVSPGVVQKLFAAVPMVKGGRCETHSKSIAKTGVKVLYYAGAGRTGNCTYNYSDDERVNDATAAFQGLAETMRFGGQLALKLRFDRLGLDTELESLQTAVSQGRALDVGNIAPVLQQIVQNERVMERVRRRADQLLQTAGRAAGQPAAGDVSAR